MAPPGPVCAGRDEPPRKRARRGCSRAPARCRIAYGAGPCPARQPAHTKAGVRAAPSETVASRPEHKQRCGGWRVLHSVRKQERASATFSQPEMPGRFDHFETPPVVCATNRLNAPLGRAMPLDTLESRSCASTPDCHCSPWKTGVCASPPDCHCSPQRSRCAGMPKHTVDSAALYAGETVRGLHDVISAEEAVARLTPDRKSRGVIGLAWLRDAAYRASAGSSSHRGVRCRPGCQEQQQPCS